MGEFDLKISTAVLHYHPSPHGGILNEPFQMWSPGESCEVEDVWRSDGRTDHQRGPGHASSERIQPGLQTGRLEGDLCLWQRLHSEGNTLGAAAREDGEEKNKKWKKKIPVIYYYVIFGGVYFKIDLLIKSAWLSSLPRGRGRGGGEGGTHSTGRLSGCRLHSNRCDDQNRV